jgi:hypothetical protein
MVRGNGMKRIKKLLIALIIAVIVMAASLLCPICGLIGTMQMGIGGVYYTCPNGHAWK